MHNDITHSSNRQAIPQTEHYLYVILDIFSRYVVGWMVATRESAILAERLINETCEKQGIAPGQLTIHADRGSSMKSKPVALLLADLGITKTHSRPYTSNDNPYSESQFKTLKYRPEFPDRFGAIEDARSFCQVFFPWYNNEHRHTGIGLLTPEMVHYGQAEAVLRARGEVLRAAYQKHPERFVRKEPLPQPLPEAAWINPPQTATSDGKLHKIQPTGVSKSLTYSGSSSSDENLLNSSRAVILLNTRTNWPGAYLGWALHRR